MSNQQQTQSSTGLVLKTKLFIPQILSTAVLRDDLLEQLDQLIDYRLILVSAPTGFGKTSLVSQWAHQSAIPVAWLSLDEDDNDIQRLLHYLIAAIQTVFPDVGNTAVELLGAEHATSTLTVLLNEITDLAEDIVLVLDDYHVISNADIHDALTYFVDNAPPHLHIILASRMDPPLPLPRLRARRQLLEIRHDALRFKSTHIHQFIEQLTQVQLAENEISALEAHTEGWVAGLQIAALSMQDHSDPVMFIHTFSGTHHHIFDYLSQEVFDRLPDHLQTFLIQTSILDDMFAPLCDAVTKSEDSQTTLEYLSKANLFVSVMDTERHCFRYHKLFSEFLRNRLLYSEFDLATLHNNASQWFEEQGIMEQAIHHALAANNFERVAELIETHADDLMWKHRSLGQILTWINQLPESVIHVRPKLCVAIGRALFIANQFDTIEFYLDAAEASNQPAILGDVAIIRAEIALFQGKPKAALQLSHQALGFIDEDNISARAIALQMEGYIYSTIGNVSPAQAALSQASDLARKVGDTFVDIFATTDLAQVYIKQGRLQDALQTYHAIIKRSPTAFYPTLANAYIGMADIFRERNDLENAADYVLRGIEDARGGKVVNLLRHAYTLLARVRFAQGDSVAALEAINHAEKLASDGNRDAPSVMRVRAHRAWLLLRGNDHKAAQEWATKSGISANDDIHYQREVEFAIFARILLQSGNIEQALVIAEKLIAVTESDGRNGNLIEDLVLVSCLYYAQGDALQATKVLCRALDISAPEGYRRVFVDEGQPLIPLLQNIATQGQHIATIRDILGIFDVETPVNSVLDQSSLIEPLSERELEVLRLLAIGLSNRQIAEQLFIGIATVKTHLVKIYGKLNVNNRTQAVTAARNLDLL